METKRGSNRESTRESKRGTKSENPTGHWNPPMVPPGSLFDLLGATAPTLSEETIARAQERRAAAKADGWASDAIEPIALPKIPSVPLRLTIVTDSIPAILSRARIDTNKSSGKSGTAGPV